MSEKTKQKWKYLECVMSRNSMKFGDKKGPWEHTFLVKYFCHPSNGLRASPRFRFHPFGAPLRLKKLSFLRVCSQNNKNDNTNVDHQKSWENISKMTFFGFWPNSDGVSPTVWHNRAAILAFFHFLKKGLFSIIFCQ